MIHMTHIIPQCQYFTSWETSTDWNILDICLIVVNSSGCAIAQKRSTSVTHTGRGCQLQWQMTYVMKPYLFALPGPSIPLLFGWKTAQLGRTSVWLWIYKAEFSDETGFLLPWPLGFLNYSSMHIFLVLQAPLLSVSPYRISTLLSCRLLYCIVSNFSAP